MANKYYTHISWPIFKSFGDSTLTRSEMDLIQAAFDAVEIDVNTLSSATTITPFYYKTTFTNSDLVGGVLTVGPGFSDYPSAISVYDSSGNQVDIDFNYNITTDVLTIDFGSLTLSGTHTLIARI